jgi:hypothetical protein
MSWIEQLKLCNVSRDQVLQLIRSLSPEHIMKLKTNLKDEMEDLIYDSLQCQC